MMILWTVLKVIGIIVLIIAILISAILFVPVSYEMCGNIEEKDYRLRISWLCYLISVRLMYCAGTMHMLLRIFFFQRDLTNPEAKEKREQRKGRRQKRRAQKKLKKRKKKQKKEEKKNRRQWKKNRKDVKLDLEETNAEMESKKETSDRTVFGSVTSDQGISDQKISDSTVSGRDSENISSEKTEPIYNDMYDTAAAEEESRMKILFLAVRKWGGILKGIYESGVIGALMPKLQIFLIRIRPRKLQGHLEFGLEDPASTGQILGGISMLPFLFRTDLEIVPDFETEKNYICGNIEMKGRIYGIHILIFGIQIWRNPQIRAMLKIKRK